MVVVLMGVSGSGKSTIGKLLAEALAWEFVEADDYHPVANIEKMRSGHPLNDEDRRPWLAALRERMRKAIENGENIVVACSALKHAYQDYLDQVDPPHIRFIHLHGSEELIRERLSKRKDHFMPTGLLHSQFETLEPPTDAVQVEITAAPEAIVEEIRRKLAI